MNPTDLLLIGAAGATLGVLLLLGLVAVVPMLYLFDRRKEGVTRRRVLRHYPWALRHHVDWRAVIGHLPRFAGVGALVFVLLTIFGLGLLVVFA